MRTHRIGSLTLGSILVLFGFLFFISIFYSELSYETIFRLWPLTLILLGFETLLGSFKYETFTYDFGAICMMLLIGFLTLSMAYADLFIRWAQNHPGFCI